MVNWLTNMWNKRKSDVDQNDDDVNFWWYEDSIR
jgi:hypothetical protein